MLINITQINPKLLTVYINGICQTTIKNIQGPLISRRPCLFIKKRLQFAHLHIKGGTLKATAACGTCLCPLLTGSS